MGMYLYYFCVCTVTCFYRHPQLFLFFNSSHLLVLHSLFSFSLENDTKLPTRVDVLTLTTLWADSVDDKLVIFFIFPRKWDNLHEMSNPVF